MSTAHSTITSLEHRLKRAISNNNPTPSSLTEIQADFKAEKKFRSTLKELELKAIESETAKNEAQQRLRQLEGKIREYKEQLGEVNDVLGEVRKKAQRQLEGAMKRFREEFDGVEKKNRVLKEQVEKAREYRLKYDFINKDYQGKNIFLILI